MTAMTERPIEDVIRDLHAAGYTPMYEPGIGDTGPNLASKPGTPPLSADLDAEYKRRWQELVDTLNARAVEREFARDALVIEAQYETEQRFPGWTTHPGPVGPCIECGGPSRVTDAEGRPHHTDCDYAARHPELHSPPA